MTDSKMKHTDAITLLKKEHRNVEAAFAQYEELGLYAHVGKRKSANKICAELILHSQLVEKLFDAKVKVLPEYIEQHVNEEEIEMFPLMKKSKLDLLLLGEKLIERKLQLSRC